MEQVLGNPKGGPVNSKIALRSPPKAGRGVGSWFGSTTKCWATVGDFSISLSIAFLIDNMNVKVDDLWGLFWLQKK